MQIHTISWAKINNFFLNRIKGNACYGGGIGNDHNQQRPAYGFAHLLWALLFIAILTNMQKNNESPAPTINGQTVWETDKMSIEQLNEHLVNRSKEVCKSAGERRRECHGGETVTSDIISPYANINNTLLGNIDNVLSCYQNTLMASIFCESQYIKYRREFDKILKIKNRQDDLIFDFLHKNGLTEKFNEFVEKLKQ